MVVLIVIYLLFWMPFWTLYTWFFACIEIYYKHIPLGLKVKSFVKELIELTSGVGKKMKYLRCDNAGEHMSSLKDLCRRHGIQLEYTAPHTPQQNGVVERAFATDTRRLYAMMIQSRLNKSICNKLWPMGIKMLERITNTSPNLQNPGS